MHNIRNMLCLKNKHIINNKPDCEDETQSGLAV